MLDFRSSRRTCLATLLAMLFKASQFLFHNCFVCFVSFFERKYKTTSSISRESHPDIAFLTVTSPNIVSGCRSHVFKEIWTRSPYFLNLVSLSLSPPPSIWNLHTSKIFFFCLDFLVVGNGAVDLGVASSCFSFDYCMQG